MMGIFYKTVFDISVFYAYAAFFFCYAIGYETNPLSYGVFLIAALVLAISGRMQYNGKICAIIAAVIPAVTLLIENTMVGRAEVILLWAYFVFMIKQETYMIYYYHFMEKFKGFVIALILPVIFFCFNVEAGTNAANMAIPYLLIFLAAGVMTLQAARHRATGDSEKQFEKFQILQTLLFFAVCILVTVTNLLQTLMLRLIVPAANKVVLFFTNTVFSFIAGILKVTPQVQIDWGKEMEGFYEEMSQEKPAEKFVEGNAWQEMISEMTGDVEEADMTEVFICVGIIIGVIILIALIGKSAKHSRVVALDVEREDLPEEEEPKKKTKRFFFDPEKEVRQQYCEFMKKAENGEHPLEKSDTTAQIMEKYNTRTTAKPEEAEQITEVYRGIRYGESTATKSDATTMKKLVKKL